MGSLVFMLYGALFTAMSVRHVSYALVALTCMFAFEQWGGIHIPFIAQNGTLVNLGILLLCAIAWFRLPTGTTFEFITYPNRVLILMLLLYAFASTLWAPLDANATARFMDSIHYLIFAVVIAPLLVMNAKEFTRYLNAVTVVGGVLVVLFAYVPSFEGRGMVVEYDFEETLHLPLALGDFAGVVMLITVLRMRGKLLPVLWALFVFGSAIFLIVKTGSRGQLIFALGALVIAMPARWKRFSVNKVVLYGLLGLMAAAAFFVVTVTENTLSSRMEYSDSATMSRVMMISILLEAWASDPMALIFGLGSSASWSQELVQFYPHVVPLEILGELGFVGFIMFSLVVVSLFLRAFSGTLKDGVEEQSLIDFCALFGAFVFALLISCKQGTLIFSTDLLMYAVLAEKCFVLGRQRDRSRSLHTSGKRKRSMMFRPRGLPV